MININVLVFLLVFVILTLIFFILKNKNEGYELREIPAYDKIKDATDSAVEDGTLIHVSLGRNDLTSPQAAVAMVGLSMLKQIGTVATKSDTPPIATMGDSTIMILAQDTIRGNFKNQGLFSAYSNSYGRISGLTPFSYAAGTLPLIIDEPVSSNFLVGSFGPEVALITSAGERNQTLTIAGTDNMPGQAVLYATAHEPLVGEDLYAAPAYLDSSPMHIASLQAQDIMRLLVAAAMIATAINSILGGIF